MMGGRCVNKRREEVEGHVEAERERGDTEIGEDLEPKDELGNVNVEEIELDELVEDDQAVNQSGKGGKNQDHLNVRG